MAEYKLYYDMIIGLPIVQELIKENKNLTKKNKILKYKNKALTSILYELSTNVSQRPKLRNNKTTIPLVKVKEEKLDEPTLCDTLANDTDSVVFIDNVNLKENIVYDLEEDEDEDDLNNGFDDSNEEAQNIIKDLKNELNKTEEEIEEREGHCDGTIGSLKEVEEEEVEEEEVEEEEVEEEEVEEVEEEVEEEEVEEEEVEEEVEEIEKKEGASEGTIGSLEEVEEEEEEVEEDEEVEEVTIKGKSYYTSNKISGIIYEITKDEEVGDEVGVFKEGKAVFHKK
jgi:hypothetical protein